MNKWFRSWRNEEETSDGGHEFPHSVSVDVPRNSASDLQAFEQTELDRIRRKTRCRMIVNLPSIPSAAQIESAFNEIRNFIAKNNPDFSQDMKCDVVISVNSDAIGWVRGKQNAKLDKIEKETKTCIKIEGKKDGIDSQLLHIKGDPADAFKAADQIQGSVDAFDPEIKRKTLEATKTSIDVKRQSSLDEEKAKDIKAGSDSQKQMHGLKPIPRTTKSYSKRPPYGSNGVEDLECNLTVHARRLLFACLLGAKHSNITRIKDQCSARIIVGPIEENRGAEFQNVEIDGGLADVITASLEIKKSFDSFDPNHPASKSRMATANLTTEAAKKINAEATLKIIREMGGFLVGKDGCRINQIKNEARLNVIDIDKKEDETGHSNVFLTGTLESVVNGLMRVLDALRNFRQRGNSESFDDQTALSTDTKVHDMNREQHGKVVKGHRSKRDFSRQQPGGGQGPYRGGSITITRLPQPSNMPQQQQQQQIQQPPGYSQQGPPQQTMPQHQGQSYPVNQYAAPPPGFQHNQEYDVQGAPLPTNQGGMMPQPGYSPQWPPPPQYMGQQHQGQQISPIYGMPDPAQPRSNSQQQPPQQYQYGVQHGSPPQAGQNYQPSPQYDTRQPQQPPNHGYSTPQGQPVPYQSHQQYPPQQPTPQNVGYGTSGPPPSQYQVQQGQQPPQTQAYNSTGPPSQPYHMQPGPAQQQQPYNMTQCPSAHTGYAMPPPSQQQGIAPPPGIQQQWQQPPPSNGPQNMYMPYQNN